MQHVDSDDPSNEDLEALAIAANAAFHNAAANRKRYIRQLGRRGYTAVRISQLVGESRRTVAYWLTTEPKEDIPNRG